MEKVYEFKKGEVIRYWNDDPAFDIALLRKFDNENFTDRDRSISTGEITILRDFTITIKIDYPPTTD